MAYFEKLIKSYFKLENAIIPEPLNRYFGSQTR